MIGQTTANTMDFPSLTLDAAIQLDKLQKHKVADLQIISSFGKHLEAPSGHNGGTGLFALSENPVNVDILNSAIYNVDGAHLVNISELEAKVNDLIDRVKKVGSGETTDEGVISGLKRFCLSLHRILLGELSPSGDDEWMPMHDERFA